MKDALVVNSVWRHARTLQEILIMEGPNKLHTPKNIPSAIAI